MIQVPAQQHLLKLKPMSETLVEQFIAALGKLESGHDVQGMETLFGSDCELGNVVVPEKFHGIEGVRKFWTKYRDTFAELRSTFRNRIISDGHAALEWTTSATSGDGSKIQYDGVSILEFGGDKIIRFRAYFDPAALGRQIKEAKA